MLNLTNQTKVVSQTKDGFTKLKMTPEQLMQKQTDLRHKHENADLTKVLVGALSGFTRLRAHENTGWFYAHAAPHTEVYVNDRRRIMKDIPGPGGPNNYDGSVKGEIERPGYRDALFNALQNILDGLPADFKCNQLNLRFSDGYVKGNGDVVNGYVNGDGELVSDIRYWFEFRKADGTSGRDTVGGRIIFSHSKDTDRAALAVANFYNRLGYTGISISLKEQTDGKKRQKTPEQRSRETALRNENNALKTKNQKLAQENTRLRNGTIEAVDNYNVLVCEYNALAAKYKTLAVKYNDRGSSPDIQPDQNGSASLQ